jgi:hypothetical protein
MRLDENENENIMGFVLVYVWKHLVPGNWIGII